MSMSVLEQPVAHPPHVEHERSVALGGEPAAQPGGVRVERAGAAERLEAPHVAQELLLGEHAGRAPAGGRGRPSASPSAAPHAAAPRLDVFRYASATNEKKKPRPRRTRR